MPSEKPDNRYLIPGLAIMGLLATGLAGLVFAFVFGDGLGLLAACLAFTGLGWMSKN